MSPPWSLRSRVATDDLDTRRLAGLAAAVDAARGRIEPELVDRAGAVVRRADERLRLSPDHTVVALAGATGSGKSSLFNQLCGLELAAVGVKRPTTSWALACSWGDGAEPLLEWLGVPPRHQINRASSLDVDEPQRDLQGLVLLDLPDHDSTEVSHHLEVERLVGLADLLVWVLDPQKYADAAIHDRFLRPLAAQRDVMVVVFNHVDELPEAAVPAAVLDVRRLLTADGLDGVPLFATSAARGDGLAELRAEMVRRVEQKRSARARVARDIEQAAQALSAATRSSEPGSFDGPARQQLAATCADAAGVPQVVAAVEQSLCTRGHRQVGWPPTRWVARFRRDPLRKMGLMDTALSGSAARTTLSVASPVQRAQISSAVRLATESVAGGLPMGWQQSTQAVSVARIEQVATALDSAIASTDLAAQRPRWWSALGALQWALLAAALVGAGWLVALVGIALLGQTSPGTARWASIPVPTWLLLGGLVLGVLMAVLGRAVVGWSAVRRARQAEVRVLAAVSAVLDELVIGPVQAELDAYRTCREGLSAALS